MEYHRYIDNYSRLKVTLCIFSYLLLLGFSPDSAYAQMTGKYRFTTYQEADGLPSELTKAIAQDTLGFIWIGTDAGLVRFDGESYLHITQGLPSNYVKSMLCRKNGQLLAATDLGLLEVVSLPDTAYVRTILAGNTNHTDTTLWYPKLLFEDSNERVWFSDNITVYCYTDAGFKRYPMPKESYPNHYHRSFSFFEDGIGGFYAMAEPGLLFRLNESIQQFERVTQPVVFSTVHHALGTGAGRVAIAAAEGFYEYVFNKEGKIISHKLIEGIEDIAYISTVDEKTIMAGSWGGKPSMIDKNDFEKHYQLSDFPFPNGNFLLPTTQGMWVGTDNGFVLMQPNIFVSLFKEQSAGYIQQIVEGDKEDYYYSDGNAVYHIWNKYGGWESKIVYTSKKGVIIRLLLTADGLLMANNEGQLYKILHDGTVLTFDLSKRGGAIYILEQDTDGNIWFCQDGLQGVGRMNTGGYITVFGKKEGLSASIGVIKCNKNGQVYFGGKQDDGYLFTFDARSQKFTNLSVNIPFEHHVSLEVFDIAFTDDGSTWLASSFGLLHLSDNLKRVNLGDDTITAIKALVADKQGNLWLAYSGGILKYQIQEQDWFQFDEKQGLPSKVVGFRNLMIDHKGSIWAATIAGITQGFSTLPAYTITPLITEITVNNEEISLDAHELYTNDILNITFASSSHPARFIQYRALHVYEGDTSMLPLHSNKEAAIGRLHAGNHHILLQAKQRGNFLWSQPQVFEFDVQLPWYKKWWVWFLLALLAVYAVRWMIKWNTTRLKVEKEKLEQLIQERTKELVEKNAEIEAQREELQQNHEELESTVDNLKNTQNQLIQAEKMSSLGQLTAGIAHEINNPINFVYAGSNTLEQLLFEMKEVVKAYHLLEETANDEEQRGLALIALKNIKEEVEYEELQIDIMALIKDIRTGAERTADIIKNLRNFSRTDEGQFIQADIESGIDSTIMLLTNKIPHGVVIEKKYGQIPPINCMASQLNQVFMNIIGNAIDAINAPGRITVTTSNHSEYIEVSIADTGHGMSDEVKRKLFDPFFTTKPIGKGTGLGMSVVYNIIDKHKGSITVESEENQGTTFIIKLPKGLGSEE